MSPLQEYIQSPMDDNVVEQLNLMAEELESLVNRFDVISSALLGLESVHNNMVEVRVELRDLRINVQACLSKYHQIIAQISTVQQLMTVFKMSHDYLSHRITVLENNDRTATEDRIRHLQNQSHGADLLISGLPESPDVDDNTLVLNLINFIGVTFESEDISEIRRMSSEEIEEAPRTLFVSVTSSMLKGSIIVAKRKKGMVVARDIHPSFSATQNVFIKEFLPPYVRNILVEANAARRAKKIQAAWVCDGVVCIRKKKNSPIVWITSLEHLEQQIGSMNLNAKSKSKTKKNKNRKTDQRTDTETDRSSSPVPGCSHDD